MRYNLNHIDIELLLDQYDRRSFTEAVLLAHRSKIRERDSLVANPRAKKCPKNGRGLLTKALQDKLGASSDEVSSTVNLLLKLFRNPEVSDRTLDVETRSLFYYLESVGILGRFHNGAQPTQRGGQYQIFSWWVRWGNLTAEPKMSTPPSIDRLYLDLPRSVWKRPT